MKDYIDGFTKKLRIPASLQACEEAHDSRADRAAN
jgi:hypothetical protein